MIGDNMGKIVAMISEDVEVKELCDRINHRRLFSDKKMQNYKKQMEDAQKSISAENEADWELLRLWLETKNRLPDSFNKQTHSIGFNIEENGIHISKDEEDYGSMPPGISMGTFSIGDLPPGLKEALTAFIKDRED